MPLKQIISGEKLKAGFKVASCLKHAEQETVFLIMLRFTDAMFLFGLPF